MEDFIERLHDPWFFLPVGYLLTVVIETPILCAALSKEHPLSRRLLSGLWLTACTYPIVVLVVPREPYWMYLTVAESVAHFGECVLFWLAFAPLQNPWRDMAVVLGANLASFSGGLFIFYLISVLGAAGA
jgi:hypothetical protein